MCRRLSTGEELAVKVRGKTHLWMLRDAGPLIKRSIFMLVIFFHTLSIFQKEKLQNFSASAVAKNVEMAHKEVIRASMPISHRNIPSDHWTSSSSVAGDQPGQVETDG